jgi:hypothetical protein
MTFKDLFSERPDAYARYRPTYPRRYSPGLARPGARTRQAVDVGTAVARARSRSPRYFRPRARPRSERGQAAQRARAPARRVPRRRAAERARRRRRQHATRSASPRRCTGSTTPLSSPRSAACWCRTVHSPCRATSSPRSRRSRRVVMELYEDHLGPYWEPERKLVETGYRTIDFPFPRARRSRHSTCA